MEQKKNVVLPAVTVVKQFTQPDVADNLFSFILSQQTPIPFP